MPAFQCRGNIDLLMVVSPAKTSQMYVYVKRYYDTVAGIASQCINKQNVKRMAQDRGFAFNILMKMNSKLGRINVSLRDFPPSLNNGTVRPLCSVSNLRFSSVGTSPILPLALRSLSLVSLR